MRDKCERKEKRETRTQVQHDTGRNLFFVHVFPRAAPPAAEAACAAAEEIAPAETLSRLARAACRESRHKTSLSVTHVLRRSRAAKARSTRERTTRETRENFQAEAKRAQVGSCSLPKKALLSRTQHSQASVGIRLASRDRCVCEFLMFVLDVAGEQLLAAHFALRSLGSLVSFGSAFSRLS